MMLKKDVKWLTLEKEDIYKGNLLLVNMAYPLRMEDGEDLYAVNRSFPDIMMKSEAAAYLKGAIARVKGEADIIPVSGYRSVCEQKEIYENSLRENGEEFTKKFVALPCHSEHQTGLAIDLGLNKENIDFIRPDFPYDGKCGEFRKIAAKYGFIERYTEKKEKITGIAHEPWHFRYVGCPHAQIIEEKGFVLEEYIEFIKSFRDNSRYLYAGIEIYYVPADTKESTIIHMEEDAVYQVSGNNVDGFIVTLWRNCNEKK